MRLVLILEGSDEVEEGMQAGAGKVLEVGSKEED